VHVSVVFLQLKCSYSSFIELSPKKEECIIMKLLPLAKNMRRILKHNYQLFNHSHILIKLNEHSSASFYLVQNQIIGSIGCSFKHDGILRGSWTVETGVNEQG